MCGGIIEEQLLERANQQSPAIGFVAAPSGSDEANRWRFCCAMRSCVPELYFHFLRLFQQRYKERAHEISNHFLHDGTGNN
jgi:hypothetical protein